MHVFKSALATHDESLYTATKEKVIRKLKGEYGFKRFLRDGYKCILEDPNDRFYSKGKTIVSETRSDITTFLNFITLYVNKLSWI